MITIHVPQPETAARRRKASEAPVGRGFGRTTGGHIGDLTDLKKFITLCPMCVGKFHPRLYGYEVWRFYHVRANCDACGQFDLHGKAFIHESLHDAVGDDRRRRGRWAS